MIGEVNVSKDECLRGTYSGVEPMGLIWSMIPFSEARVRTLQASYSCQVLVNLQCIFLEAI